jgi:hypothetical protein
LDQVEKQGRKPKEHANRGSISKNPTQMMNPMQRLCEDCVKKNQKEIDFYIWLVPIMMLRRLRKKGEVDMILPFII